MPEEKPKLLFKQPKPKRPTKAERELEELHQAIVKRRKQKILLFLVALVILGILSVLDLFYDQFDLHFQTPLWISRR